LALYSFQNNKKETIFCGKPFGANKAPLIVAEIGFNHNGDIDLAREMIKSAAENGADIVKLQTFIGSELISKTVKSKDPDHPAREIFLYEFFQRYQLSHKDYETLFKFSKNLDIPLFSTPFDDSSLDMLLEAGMPAIKIASPDLTCLPFLARLAQIDLPIVLSTGMGTNEEIETALKILRSEGNQNIILLHCVSNYPSQYHEMNLACLKEMTLRFKLPVGLSDHTTDNLSGIVAASLGAVMIEKHFTIDRSLPGVDQGISMEPHELAALKEATVNVQSILGDGMKRVQASEEIAKRSARRSLIARVDIESGTALSPDMISLKRPGTGISPTELERIVGKTTKTNILAEQVITWEMIL
jgi:N-acetylneuraminate synthase/N,N'-diacetyllegionaminate synthase